MKLKVFKTNHPHRKIPKKLHHYRYSTQSNRNVFKTIENLQQLS